jgi:glucosylceramidase
VLIVRRRVVAGAVLLAAGAVVAPAPRAFAANEPVNVYLTSASDSGGRTVTRGLQRQAPIAFTGSGGSADQTIVVDENATYQQFEGAGASFTDTAAFDLRGSGALSAATQADVLDKLFSPTAGIGVGALRNVIGSSDLARDSYSYDTTCCDLDDFSLSRDSDVLALTKQARGLNPAMFVMASPWSAPALDEGQQRLRPGLSAGAVLRDLRAVFRQVSPGVRGAGCAHQVCDRAERARLLRRLPVDAMDRFGLDYFAKTNLLPALQGAGLGTKLLIGDWNFDTYDAWVSPLINDSAIRNHPNATGRSSANGNQLQIWSCTGAANQQWTMPV